MRTRYTRWAVKMAGGVLNEALPEFEELAELLAETLVGVLAEAFEDILLELCWKTISNG